MIDVSCFVGPGPLVAPELSTPDAVGLMLGRAGVMRAGVSPMAGLFESDPAANDDLMTLPEFFAPIPIVDPRWPDLAARLRIYRSRGCVAVRITPGGHGYLAADAVELKRACGVLNLVLVLQMRVADPRNLPPDLDLPHVDVADATVLARSAPKVTMIVAGARVPEFAPILGASTVLADISLAEEPDVLTRAVAAHGADRLLIGTHAPFLTPVAARQKLMAARLAPADRAAVRQYNAERLGL
ncbi:MAG: amidohydrolase family protein [Kibdelosporangium sp.]